MKGVMRALEELTRSMNLLYNLCPKAKAHLLQGAHCQDHGLRDRHTGV